MRSCGDGLGFGGVIRERWPLGVAALFLAVVVAVVMAVLFPDKIYHYYVSPVVRDAAGKPSAYNVVNTLTYAAGLALSGLLIYKFFLKLGVCPGFKFLSSFFPFIVLGSALRCVEDAGMLTFALAVLVISPLIYVTVGAFSLLTLWAIYKFNDYQIYTYWGVVLVVSNILIRDYFYAAYSLCLFMLAVTMQFREKTHRLLLFSASVALLPLQRLVMAVPVANSSEIIVVPLVAIFAAGAFLALIAALARIFGGVAQLKSLMKVVSVPQNTLILVAHMFDAAATYRAVTLYGYTEKHVLPSYFIAATGPLSLFVVKLIIVLFLLYVIDVWYKNWNTTLRGTVKFVAYVLGFAPGLRDWFRIIFAV